MSNDHFKRMIAILSAVVALFAAVIALLQGDASARDDRANRDTKRYSVEALGRAVSGEARANFAYNAAFQTWNEFDTLARSAEARGDTAAVERYERLRDSLNNFSPLLKQPYFDSSAGAPDLARYETDTYYTDVIRLREQFAAAAVVKDAWDAKANTYIVHLTLLAVALFLLTLSTTIAVGWTRWVFTVAGVGVTLVAVTWALAIWAQPVVDIREQGTAIEAYTRGTTLGYQSKPEEAIAAFNEAITAAPMYANAYVARANAQFDQLRYEQAAADYEQAIANGSETTNVLGSLAWCYYSLGRFDDAIAMGQRAVASGPTDIWPRFDLAQILLSAGRTEEGRTLYKEGMELAAQQVKAARDAGKVPPSDLWWSLDQSADTLDDLLNTLETGKGTPPVDRIADRVALKPAAEEQIIRLKSLSVGLEYSGVPPTSTLTAHIGAFEFGDPDFDADGNIIDFDQMDAFPSGTKEVAVHYDYSGMKDGQEVLIKVYINGEEDPSWRVIDSWDSGESGSITTSIGIGYSDAFVLKPGNYTIELYIDSNLAQRGSFTVEE